MSHSEETNAAIKQLKIGTLFWMNWWWQEGGELLVAKALFRRIKHGCECVVVEDGRIVSFGENKLNTGWTNPTVIIPLVGDEAESMRALLLLKPERIYL